MRYVPIVLLAVTTALAGWEYRGTLDVEASGGSCPSADRRLLLGAAVPALRPGAPVVVAQRSVSVAYDAVPTPAPLSLPGLTSWWELTSPRVGAGPPGSGLRYRVPVLRDRLPSTDAVAVAAVVLCGPRIVVVEQLGLRRADLTEVGP